METSRDQVLLLLSRWINQKSPFRIISENSEFRVHLIGQLVQTSQTSIAVVTQVNILAVSLEGAALEYRTPGEPFSFVSEFFGPESEGVEISLPSGLSFAILKIFPSRQSSSVVQ